MSKNGGGTVVDLTTPENDRRSKRREKAKQKMVVEIPYEAYLPVGVDATDDIVLVDSDSENEKNLAETEVQALLKQRMKKKAHHLQTKLNHPKAIAAAAKKRKRQREEEAAKRKRQLEEEEAKKKQERAEFRKQQRAQQAAENREREKQRRRAEAEALRKNPPSNVNFIIVDSDPEEDLTMSRPSPEKTKPATTGVFNNPQSRTTPPPTLPTRFDAWNQAKRTNPESTRIQNLKTGSKISSSSKSNTDVGRNQNQMPYQGTSNGGVRVGAVPPRRRKQPSGSFDRNRYFTYGVTREDAAQEQERLFQQAAERLRQRQQHGHPDVQDARPTATVYGPTFHAVIANIQDKYPIHWTWKSPYSCLGLPPNASVNSAKQQYRALVRCYHPDKSRRDTANKFHAIVLAFKKVCRLHEGEESAPL